MFIRKFHKKIPRELIRSRELLVLLISTALLKSSTSHFLKVSSKNILWKFPRYLLISKIFLRVKINKNNISIYAFLHKRQKSSRKMQIFLDNAILYIQEQTHAINLWYTSTKIVFYIFFFKDMVKTQGQLKISVPLIHNTLWPIV